MRRARNKKLNDENRGYKSDMTELGYNPDTYVPPEEDEKEKVEEPAQMVMEEQVTEGPVKKSRKKKKGKNKLVIFMIALLTIMVAFLLVMGLGGQFTTNEEGQMEEFVAPVDKATGKINILVTGVDADGLRTDTIMVASYDMDDNNVKVLSIPRDTRMYIGNKYQKINAAHAISKNGKINGVQGTIEAVTRLTGIPINYYVEVSFDAFSKTIDALGGVDFDVPQNMYYNDPVQKLKINLKKGFQHLDGDKAEQLVRFRMYPEGDLARVKVQQDFIKAVVEQKLNLDILNNAKELFQILKSDIKTNFTLSHILKYVNNLKELQAENVKMVHLPGEFSDETYTASYWLPDMEKTKELIQLEFGYDAENITIHSADSKSVSKINNDRKTTAPSPSQEAEEDDEDEDDIKTQKPTSSPKATQTPKPTKKPSGTPTDEPTVKPTKEPEAEKTERPTPKPTKEPEEIQKPARPTPRV